MVPSLVSAASNPLQASDLTYLGAFALPQSDSLYWHPYTLAFNPDGNGGQGSLYTSNAFDAIEVTIPDPACTVYTGSACTTKDSVQDLYYNHRAAALVPGTSTVAPSLNPVDPTGGELTALNTNNSTGSEEVVIGGLAYLPAHGSQTTGKLYWGLNRYYDANNWDFPNLGYSDPDFSSPSSIVHLGDSTMPYSRQHAMKTGSYLLAADSTWADTYANGDYLLSGATRDALGAMDSGEGPQLFASAPWNLQNPTLGQDVPIKTLMTHYGSQDSDPTSVIDPAVTAANGGIPVFTTSFPQMTSSDEWGGAAWVKAGTKQAVVFTALKGTYPGCYGNGVISFAVSSLTSVGSLATVSATIGDGHNIPFQTGDTVTISGANEDAYNGTFTITVTSDTTFTYNLSQSATSPATGTVMMTDSSLYGRRLYDGSGFFYCYDPAKSNSEGYHNYPYTTELDFFNIDDLTSAAQSSNSPYTAVSQVGSSTFSPYPYLQFDLTPYLYPDWTQGVPMYVSPKGIVYDSKRGRLYVVQSAAYNGQQGDYPVVHVFQINSGVPDDTTAPAAPSNLNVQ